MVPPYIFSHTFNYIMTTAFAGRMAVTKNRTTAPILQSGMIVLWERESASKDVCSTF